MATVSITDEEIEAALDIIHDHNPTVAEQAEADYYDAIDEAKRIDIGKTILSAANTIQRRAARATSREKERPAAAPAIDEAPPKTNDAKRVLGIIAWCFGAILWVPGSRYALDGWTLAINVVLTVARLEARVPLAVGLWALLLFPVGILYSMGEQAYIPLRIYKTKVGRRFVFLGWGVVLIWLIVNGTDVGATYLGATTLAADAWPITIWMSHTPWASVTWTTVLTYLPEVFFILGARWMGIRIQWPWNRRKR